MIKRIYNGSEKIIKEPIFGYGKTYNDYGLAFTAPFYIQY